MSDNLTFVSYSRADSPFAVRLASDLRANGASVWIDQLDIPAGARWDSAIEDALRRSARVLALLSPKAVASQNVLDEVSFAMDEGKTLVPVLVEPCTIPMRLRRLQYVDFTSAYETALGRLLVTLGVARTTVSSVATPAAEPQPAAEPPRVEPTSTYEPSFGSPRTGTGDGRNRAMWLGIAGVAAALIVVAILANRDGGSSSTVSDRPAELPTSAASAPPVSNASPETAAPEPTTTSQADNAPAAPPASTAANKPAPSTPSSPQPMGTAETAVANQARLAPAGQLGGGGFGLAPMRKVGDMAALTTLVGQLSDRSSLTDTELRALSDARLYACAAITDACFDQANGSVTKLLTAVCRRQAAAAVPGCVADYEETMTRLQREKIDEALKRIKPG